MGNLSEQHHSHQEHPTKPEGEHSDSSLKIIATEWHEVPAEIQKSTAFKLEYVKNLRAKLRRKPIQWTQKGFGFIKLGGGDKEIFVHATSVITEVSDAKTTVASQSDANRCIERRGNREHPMDVGNHQIYYDPTKVIHESKGPKTDTIYTEAAFKQLTEIVNQFQRQADVESSSLESQAMANKRVTQFLAAGEIPSELQDVVENNKRFPEGNTLWKSPVSVVRGEQTLDVLVKRLDSSFSIAPGEAPRATRRFELSADTEYGKGSTILEVTLQGWSGFQLSPREPVINKDGKIEIDVNWEMAHGPQKMEVDAVAQPPVVSSKGLIVQQTILGMTPLGKIEITQNLYDREKRSMGGVQWPGKQSPLGNYDILPLQQEVESKFFLGEYAKLNKEVLPFVDKEPVVKGLYPENAVVRWLGSGTGDWGLDIEVDLDFHTDAYGVLELILENVPENPNAHSIQESAPFDIRTFTTLDPEEISTIISRRLNWLGKRYRDLRSSIQPEVVGHIREKHPDEWNTLEAVIEYLDKIQSTIETKLAETISLEHDLIILNDGQAVPNGVGVGFAIITVDRDDRRSRSHIGSQGSQHPYNNRMYRLDYTAEEVQRIFSSFEQDLASRAAGEKLYKDYHWEHDINRKLQPISKVCRVVRAQDVSDEFQGVYKLEEAHVLWQSKATFPEQVPELTTTETDPSRLSLTEIREEMAELLKEIPILESRIFPQGSLNYVQLLPTLLEAKTDIKMEHTNDRRNIRVAPGEFSTDGSERKVFTVTSPNGDKKVITYANRGLNKVANREEIDQELKDNASPFALGILKSMPERIQLFKTILAEARLNVSDPVNEFSPEVVRAARRVIELAQAALEKNIVEYILDSEDDTFRYQQKLNDVAKKLVETTEHLHNHPLLKDLVGRFEYTLHLTRPITTQDIDDYKRALVEIMKEEEAGYRFGVRLQEYQNPGRQRQYLGLIDEEGNLLLPDRVHTERKVEPTRVYDVVAPTVIQVLIESYMPRGVNSYDHRTALTLILESRTGIFTPAQVAEVLNQLSNHIDFYSSRDAETNTTDNRLLTCLGVDSAQVVIEAFQKELNYELSQHQLEKLAKITVVMRPRANGGADLSVETEPLEVSDSVSTLRLKSAIREALVPDQPQPRPKPETRHDALAVSQLLRIVEELLGRAEDVRMETKDQNELAFIRHKLELEPNLSADRRFKVQKDIADIAQKYDLPIDTSEKRERSQSSKEPDQTALELLAKPLTELRVIILDEKIPLSNSGLWRKALAAAVSQGYEGQLLAMRVLRNKDKNLDERKVKEVLSTVTKALSGTPELLRISAAFEVLSYSLTSDVSDEVGDFIDEWVGTDPNLVRQFKSAVVESLIQLGLAGKPFPEGEDFNHFLESVLV